VIAGHEGGVAAGHLGRGTAHQLAGRIADVVHAAPHRRPIRTTAGRLGGFSREVAAEAQVAVR
jgi:hypothetical protein